MSLKAALLVLAVAYYVDWLSVITWSLWCVETVFGISDHCFFSNAYLKSLFGAIEQRDLSKVKIPATIMAEINAEDYSYEALRVLSQNWRQPVVVRGLFTTTTAVQKWKDPDYLINGVFGANETSVVQNATIAHSYDRICHNGVPFPHAFSVDQPFDVTMRRVAAGLSKETIVFPPASRSKRFRNGVLEAAFNRLVDQDLDLARIGGTFSEGVASTSLTQMFIGAFTAENASSVVGTGWHCDICNNFIVQIAGVKRWIMVDPIYSALMRPTMNTGKTAVAGGHFSVGEETLPYFPHHVVDLYPGDFLYNPEFYWHSIENLAVGPYSFGLVSRQCHLGRNFKSNAIFTSMILINHLVAGIYDPEARQRVWSAISGSTLMKPMDVDPKVVYESGYTK